jgi:hypothetical protein
MIIRMSADNHPNRPIFTSRRHEQQWMRMQAVKMIKDESW